ncbi:MAG: hypothetical protein WCS01_02645 [bacterium]
MTLTQLKRTCRTLTSEQATVMMFLLRHRLRADSEDNRRELSSRHDDVAAGRRLTLQQVKRIDRSLKAEGA